MQQPAKRPNVLARFFHSIKKRIMCRWGVDLDGDGVHDVGGTWDGEAHATHVNVQHGNPQ